MNKIPSKSIQMFVAGALALMGFDALIWTTYYLIYSKDIVFVGASVFSALALPIGIAMLAGNERAMFWARIYLLLGIVGAIVSICLSIFQMFPKAHHLNWWRVTSDFLTPAILLGLLVWSSSKDIRDEPVA